MSKVHPIPRKRNISDATRLCQQKKLRRLPHIFAKVLELPFRPTAHVSVLDTPTAFRFAVAADGFGPRTDVRTEVIEICPGVVKIVVRGDDDELMMDLDLGSPIDELEIDLWRFRLPECTRPEMASAVCVDGELLVVVPKFDGENWSGNARLVVVQ